MIETDVIETELREVKAFATAALESLADYSKYGTNESHDRTLHRCRMVTSVGRQIARLLEGEVYISDPPVDFSLDRI